MCGDPVMDVKCWSFFLPEIQTPDARARRPISRGSVEFLARLARVLPAIYPSFRSKLSPMNREKLVEEMHKNIYYSDKYYDNEYEYRHVVLPRELVKLVPKTHLMSEQEWRGIGVQQSKGWIHYMTHSPEPHILLFKRPITTPPQ